MSLIIDIHSTMLHGYLNLVSEKGKKTYRFLLELQIYSFLLDFTGPSSTHLNTFFETSERIWREESQDILGVEGTRQ